MKRIIKTSFLAVLLFSVTVSFTSCNESNPVPATDLTSQDSSLPREDLSTDEINSLIFMREEEKLARDVYAVLYAKWKSNIFSNIGESEQTHMDVILQLLNKYNLPDPVGDNSAGIFDNTQLQELYNHLVEQGSTSMADAMQVGATIEDLDIFDLENAMIKIDNQDIRLVYESLTKGSRNHLRSFYSNILLLEETYVPQFITQEKFDAIVNSVMEKGR
jgi:hypothetical protein